MTAPIMHTDLNIKVHPSTILVRQENRYFDGLPERAWEWELYSQDGWKRPAGQLWDRVAESAVDASVSA